MSTVLHVITSLGSGGAERMLTQLVTHSAGPSSPRQLVVCLVANGEERNASLIREAGVTLHCLGGRRGMPSPILLVRLARVFRRERPDVVMTWLYHSDLLGSIAARLAGIRRVIWNIRCSEVDFHLYSRWTRWTVAALAKLSRLPWVVATNSHAGRRAHEQLGYQPGRWVYLPNGVDVERWRPDVQDRSAVRGELGFGNDTVAIVTVARADPMKDHASLFAAAPHVIKRHPNVRFVLVGRGTQELPVPEAVRPWVTVLGERQDIPRLLRGCDIAVLCSRFGEGFPNAVAEAMATGLPHVVTDVGDAKMLVGETGIVVPCRDSSALAEAIDALVRGGTSEWADRGAAARDRVVQRWSLQAAIKCYEDLFQEALRAGRQPMSEGRLKA